MRSKTILAAVIAGALGAPLTALADSDSYGSTSPSAGASVNNGTSVQGSLGTQGQSAGSYGKDRDDRYAQNDDRDHDRGKHRGRDKRKDKDHQAGAQPQNDAQYGSASSPSRNDQYAQSSQAPSSGNSQYSSNSRY
jgi:hypothetical protein